MTAARGDESQNQPGHSVERPGRYDARDPDARFAVHAARAGTKGLANYKLKRWAISPSSRPFLPVVRVLQLLALRLAMHRSRNRPPARARPAAAVASATVVVMAAAATAAALATAGLLFLFATADASSFCSQPQDDPQDDRRAAAVAAVEETAVAAAAAVAAAVNKPPPWLPQLPPKAFACDSRPTRTTAIAANPSAICNTLRFIKIPPKHMDNKWNFSLVVPSAGMVRPRDRTSVLAFTAMQSLRASLGRCRKTGLSGAEPLAFSGHRKQPRTPRPLQSPGLHAPYLNRSCWFRQGT